jgi:hypothetical protein
LDKQEYHWRGVNVMEKRCPLTFHTRSKEVDQSVFEPCLQEKCGWWSSDNKKCGIINLANAVKSIKERLADTSESS